MMPLNIPKDIDKYFYNRKTDIKKISLQISGLNDDLSSQLLITGQHGVGKTFLLKKILNDQKEDMLTVYLDIAEIYSQCRGNINECIILKELLYKLIELVSGEDAVMEKVLKLFYQFKIKNISFYDAKSVSKIPIPKIRDNYQKLSKFVMELPQCMVDSSPDINGIIIVIDEFQQLKHVKNPDAFFWLFRSYVQKQFNVCYIFTGSVSKTADVIQMINGPMGAFGGRMIQIDIGPFSKEETLNYIKDKSDGIKFSDDGFERFYKCTKGIPAYINAFCNVLNPGEIYDGEMVKKTFIMQMDQIVIMWLYVWGRLNDAEKNIVIAFVENDSLFLKDLQDLMDLSKTTLIKYLDSLSMKGIIKFTENGYVLNDDMLKTWLVTKLETEGHYPY
jgi:hypothetical protein